MACRHRARPSRLLQGLRSPATWCATVLGARRSSMFPRARQGRHEPLDRISGSGLEAALWPRVARLSGRYPSGIWREALGPCHEPAIGRLCLVDLGPCRGACRLRYTEIPTFDSATFGFWQPKPEGINRRHRNASPGRRCEPLAGTMLALTSEAHLYSYP